jgi:hypothetical protein
MFIILKYDGVSLEETITPGNDGVVAAISKIMQWLESVPVERISSAELSFRCNSSDEIEDLHSAIGVILIGAMQLVADVTPAPGPEN